MSAQNHPALDDENRRYLRYAQLLNGTTALFALALALWILLDPGRRNDPGWVFWLILSIALLHTIEEYIFPGGFIPWFNQTVCRSQDVYLPLSARRAFFTDGTAAVLTIPILLLISAGLLPIYAAFFLAMALYLNAFLHITEWVMHARYSPGGITAILLIVPGYTAIAFFYLAQGVVTPLQLAAAFLAGILLNAVFYTFLRRWSKMPPSQPNLEVSA